MVLVVHLVWEWVDLFGWRVSVFERVEGLLWKGGRDKGVKISRGFEVVW